MSSAQAAVILQEEEQRVIELAFALEFGHDAANVLVQPVHHGGIDLHAADFPLFVRHLRPVAHGWRRGPVGPHEAQLFEPREACVPDGVVAGVVFAFVLGDILRAGLHGPVGGSVGQVHEEGLLR